MVKILILQGHPDTREAHLCHKLAEAYASGAEDNGHQVRRIEIARMDFPLLKSKAAWQGSEVPPSIARAQESLVWAEHLLIIFPLWLGDMPALLKGFFEQVLRPGFAVRGKVGFGFEPLLTEKSAHIVVTMGMPELLYRWYFHAHAVRLLKSNILNFVGIRPIGSTLVGNAEGLSAYELRARLESMRQSGAGAR